MCFLKAAKPLTNSVSKILITVLTVTLNVPKCIRNNYVFYNVLWHVFINAHAAMH